MTAATTAPEASVEPEIATLASKTPAEKAEEILARIVKAKGGARREGQVTIATHVAMAISTSRPLLLQGGTGVGKSIGYLAGALATGKQCLVAPHTKALQDQLVGDLDLLASAFTEDPPTYAVVKGRASYLCRAKLAPAPEQGSTQDFLPGVEDEPELEADSQVDMSELAAEVTALQKWSTTTTSGDRSDVSFPVTSKAWGQVSVTAEDCTTKACPFYKDESCFAEQARNNAKTADIIVANQALLAKGMELPGLLPEDLEGVIIDEAHEFPSVVSGAFGAEITPWRIASVMKKADPALRKVAPSRTQNLADKVTDLVAQINGTIRPPKNPDRALAANPNVTQLLEKAVSYMMEAKTLSGLITVKDEKEQAQKEILTRMLNNLINAIKIFLLGTTDDQVVWVEQNRGSAVFRAARFEVAETIQSLLLSRFGGVVFTSATIAVSGSFEPPAKNYGLKLHNEFALEEGLIQPGQVVYGTSNVDSPFDYQGRALLWAPSNMPLPNNKDEYPAAVAGVAEKVARAAGGRTLVLCTSWASVTSVSEHLERTLGNEYPVLVQRPGEPSKDIAHKFARDPRAILVGTRTFWTGVSIEGDACAAIIIDKVPFPAPSEPIISARTEKADRERQGSGFSEVSLAEACLTMTQGSGRLIRTVSDRGVIVICDPRINPGNPAKKSYSTKVLHSMPPAPGTTDETTALDYLKRINATADDSRNEVDIEAAEEETPA